MSYAVVFDDDQVAGENVPGAADPFREWRSRTTGASLAVSRLTA
jgi:hypothetical protein